MSEQQIGATRIVAEWCSDATSENIDLHKYEFKMCGSIEQAAKLAEANDVDGEGFVLIQEYKPTGYGFGEWVTVERVVWWVMLAGKAKAAEAGEVGQ